MSRSPSLSPRAFLMLLLLACMFGGNHVAARYAFNDGVDVATAVTLRSGATALVVGLLVWQQRVAWAMNARQRAVLAGVSVLVAVQSLSLYAAVARLPVALALLAFNTWPMWTAFWARVLYGHRPERRTAAGHAGAAAGAGAGAGRVRRRVGPGRAGAVVAHRHRRGLCHHRCRHLRPGDGDHAARDSPASTAGCAAPSRWRGRPAGAGRHAGAGRAAAAAAPCRLVGPGDADAAVRHRLHHHVHAAAAAGRGGQLAHPQRRTGGRHGDGLGAAGPAHRAGAGGGRADRGRRR
jgi:hypothetical protein